MSYLVYSFDAVRRFTEERLSEELGRRCNIRLRRNLSKGAIAAIQRIESVAFRKELRYDRTELLSRSREHGFVLLLVLSREKPIAFLFGFRDPSESSAFYLDTVATSVEGKGVGSSMIHLANLLCLESGYRSITLRTEEQDEKGRTLRRFYEKIGFHVYPCDPSEGIAMRRDLDWNDVMSDTEREFASVKPWQFDRIIQSSFYLSKSVSQDLEVLNQA